MSIEIEQASAETDINLSDSVSFFAPFAQYHVREVLGVGGEAYIAKSAGQITGVFMFDKHEQTGAIYTHDRDVFDRFFKMKPDSLIFAEVEADHPKEVYDVYSIDLRNLNMHTFNHEVTAIGVDEIDELGAFMTQTHQGVNKRWVTTALNNGDTCFAVRMGTIAGVGWVSLARGHGRLHTLFVKPQYRRTGIGADLLYSRLFWLKSHGVKTAFSEIAESNVACSRIAMKAGMTISEKIYAYLPKQRLNDHTASIV
jgi:GNAT superfamily N-acetyltransferase